MFCPNETFIHELGLWDQQLTNDLKLQKDDNQMFTKTTLLQGFILQVIEWN